MVKKETKKSYLIDNFLEFKKKVELNFGKLEVIAEKTPDFYARIVLASGFINYLLPNGLDENVISRIQTEQGSYDHENPEHSILFNKYLKEEYLTWAKQHHLHEPLLELGWEKYCKD